MFFKGDVMEWLGKAFLTLKHLGYSRKVRSERASEAEETEREKPLGPERPEMLEHCKGSPCV